MSDPSSLRLKVVRKGRPVEVSVLIKFQEGSIFEQKSNERKSFNADFDGEDAHGGVPSDLFFLPRYLKQKGPLGSLCVCCVQPGFRKFTSPVLFGVAHSFSPNRHTLIHIPHSRLVEKGQEENATSFTK